MPGDARALGKAIGRCRWAEQVLETVREARAEVAEGNENSNNDDNDDSNNNNNNNNGSGNGNSNNNGKNGDVAHELPAPMAFVMPQVGLDVEMEQVDVEMHRGKDGRGRKDVAAMFRDASSESESDGESDERCVVTGKKKKGILKKLSIHVMIL